MKNPIESILDTIIIVGVLVSLCAGAYAIWGFTPPPTEAPLTAIVTMKNGQVMTIPCTEYDVDFRRVVITNSQGEWVFSDAEVVIAPTGSLAVQPPQGVPSQPSQQPQDN